MIVLFRRTIVLTEDIILLFYGVIMDLVDLKFQLEEIRSCLIMTKRAIDNEFEDITASDISNCLEISIRLMNKAIFNTEQIKP